VLTLRCGQNLTNMPKPGHMVHRSSVNI